MYLAALTRSLSMREKIKLRPLIPWFLCLVGWPLLLFFVPLQDALVQLVGLRGNVFFLPFLLVGAMMNGADIRRVAKALVWLNAIALIFALAETVFGVQRFYSVANPVNLGIFRSSDVYFAGKAHYRIPATFVSSAEYASAMIASVPLLLGALGQEARGTIWRHLLFAAVGASAVGVFLAGSRSSVVVLLIMGASIMLPGRVRNVPRGALIALVIGVGVIVAFTPRMQRFVTLEDSSYVTKRLHSSMNESFLSLAIDYPLGNGLGGGGTSLPYFLQERLTNPIGLENEYARILAEQGIPGLVLWMAFIVWLLTRPAARTSDPTYRGKSLARLFCFICFATAPIGIGMLDAIPGTEMLLLLAGWFAAQEPIRAAAPVLRPVPQTVFKAGAHA